VQAHSFRKATKNWGRGEEVADNKIGKVAAWFKVQLVSY